MAEMSRDALFDLVESQTPGYKAIRTEPNRLHEALPPPDAVMGQNLATLRQIYLAKRGGGAIPRPDAVDAQEVREVYKGRKESQDAEEPLLPLGGTIVRVRSEHGGSDREARTLVINGQGRIVAEQG